MPIPINYHYMQACVQYHAYEFTLPETLPESSYLQLRAFIQQLGEVESMLGMELVRVRNQDFFIDFPAYGFPLFKISFYKHVDAATITAQLEDISNFLQRCD